VLLLMRHQSLSHQFVAKDETNNKKEIGKTLREKGVLARVK
jgi:hypothetical protein